VRAELENKNLLAGHLERFLGFKFTEATRLHLRAVNQQNGLCRRSWPKQTCDLLGGNGNSRSQLYSSVFSQKKNEKAIESGDEH